MPSREKYVTAEKENHSCDEKHFRRVDGTSDRIWSVRRSEVKILQAGLSHLPWLRTRVEENRALLDQNRVEMASRPRGFGLTAELKRKVSQH